MFSLLHVFHSVHSSGQLPLSSKELLFSGGLSQATIFNLQVVSSSFRALSLFQYHPPVFLIHFPSSSAQVTLHLFLGLPFSSSLYIDFLTPSPQLFQTCLPAPWTQAIRPAGFPNIQFITSTSWLVSLWTHLLSFPFFSKISISPG